MVISYLTGQDSSQGDSDIRLSLRTTMPQYLSLKRSLTVNLKFSVPQQSIFALESNLKDKTQYFPGL